MAKLLLLLGGLAHFAEHCRGRGVKQEGYVATVTWTCLRKIGCPLKKRTHTLKRPGRPERWKTSKTRKRLGTDRLVSKNRNKFGWNKRRVTPGIF